METLLTTVKTKYNCNLQCQCTIILYIYRITLDCKVSSWNTNTFPRSVSEMLTTTYRTVNKSFCNNLHNDCRTSSTFPLRPSHSTAVKQNILVQNQVQNHQIPESSFSRSHRTLKWTTVTCKVWLYSKCGSSRGSRVLCMEKHHNFLLPLQLTTFNVPQFLLKWNPTSIDIVRI